MVNMKRPCTIFLIFMTSIIIFPTLLSAALFEQLVVSPLAASMGSAVTAYPPGALAIHYNPAGLAEIPGTRFDNSIGMAFTYRELTLNQAIDPSTGKLW